MKETDLQTLSDSISTIIVGYQNSTTQAERDAALGDLQKVTNIVNNDEKQKNENALKQDQFQLNKDHVYAQDSLEEKRFKQQVKDSSEKNELEKMKLEIEKARLDIQHGELIQKQKESRNDMRFRLVTFGITTVIGLAEVIIPLIVYRKLAYTNLNLIYKDEGRPSNDYKDAIKNVHNLIRKK